MNSSTMPSPPALELKDVTKTFGSKTALAGVSLHVNRNEVVGLIGENGAGKSTLLKLLAGLHQPDTGTVTIHGKETRLRSSAAAAAQGIGVVHQEQSLITNLTVADNVTLGGSARRSTALGRLGWYRWRQLNAETKELLNRIGIELDPQTKVEHLSFAERQMIEIAKAVGVGSRSGLPPILILDEPTSVLEPPEIKRLAGEIESLRRLGSVIFVSHRLQEVLDFTDRVYVLRHGRVVAERVSAQTHADELFELMTGRPTLAERPAPRGFSGKLPALELRNISSRQGVENVSFAVFKGQIHCLVGATSSGAEQLARLIFGLDSTYTGQVLIEGIPLKELTPRQAIDAGVGYVPSERRLEGMVEGMTLAENMTLVQPRTSISGVLDGKGRLDLTTDWIERLDVRPPRADADIADLSGGNQQKVVLAKWLGDERLRVLVLDHPMRGLDPGAIENVKAAVRRASEEGVAVLMIADTLEEALETADFVTVMKDGSVTGSFDLATQRTSVIDLLEKLV